MSVTHTLNCAKLRPLDTGQVPYSCSCGAEQPRPRDLRSPEYGSGGVLVHNHGPAEGRGLDCPEYSTVNGLRGQCVLRAEDYPIALASRDSVGSPVTSERREALEAEVRTTSSTGGQKGVKQARFDLLPPEALALVAEHYGKGAEKYEVHNWRRGFEWSKSYAAMQRHAHAFWSGEDLDPETESPHLAAVVFHALTLLTFQAEHPQFDDRYKRGTK